MQTAQPVRHQVLRSAGLGAIGFGLGLALAGLFLGALTYQIHDFDSGRLIGSVMYAAAGAVGGASLGWASGSPRQAVRLALASAAGLGLGYFVTTTIISGWIDEHVQGEMIWAAVFVVQYALIGALAGLLLGLVQPDRRRRAGWLVLAGIVGFGLLYWPLQAGTFLVIYPILSHLPGANASADFTQFSTASASAVRGCLSGAVTGIVAGACLGIGNVLGSSRA